MQVKPPSPARGSLPGPSRRITVEPLEVPVTTPREEPATLLTVFVLPVVYAMVGAPRTGGRRDYLRAPPPEEGGSA